MSVICRYYHWPPNFWRRMGRREFYGWVDQVAKEQSAAQEQPDSWRGTEESSFWQNAREKRRRLQGR